MANDIYMVIGSSDSDVVFAKQLELFRLQGGFELPWERNWQPVIASNIEEARKEGKKLSWGYPAPTGDL